MDPKKLQEMDAITGLGADKMAEMDRVAGGLPATPQSLGGILAKQAITETDPVKKQQLLVASRKADVEMSANLPPQPGLLLRGAAKTQEVLGKTPILPTAGGILGRVITGGSPIGTGIGSAVGKRLKQMNLRGGVESVIPTQEELAETALTGIEAATIDKLFTSGSKYIQNALDAGTINPGKIALFLREKAAEMTPTINTGEIIKAGEKWAKLDPISKDYWKIIKTGLTSPMDTKDLLKLLTTWGDRIYTTSGDVKDKAGAALMKEIYGASRQTIAEQAPEIAQYTKNLKDIKDLPGLMKTVQKGTWLLLKLFGIGKLATGL